MNVKLKSFKRPADICLGGHIFRLYSNIWCDLDDNEVKLTYAHLKGGLVSTYVYHMDGDAVCFWAEKSRIWRSTLERLYVDRTILLLEYLKDKSDYEIFCHFVEKKNTLLHSSVFKFVKVLREKNLKYVTAVRLNL